MTINVPVLSLKDIAEPATRAALAKQLGEAARTSGFFQIVDHGISAELITEAFAIAKTLFDLPVSSKMAVVRNPKTNRGYEIIGGQSLDGAVTEGQHEGKSKTLAANRAAEEEQDPDMKEGYMVGPPGFTEKEEYWGRFGHGTNIFPPKEEVPGMEECMAKYYTAIYALSCELMKIVALSLDLPENTFEALCRKPAAAIRLLHYPPEKKGTGAGQHTDFGLITLLATSGAPGLELWTGTAWVPVEPVEGAYIVNVGDMLALYTGGEYKSSLHRVMNTSGVDRYSMPFFLDGNSDILVEPTMGPNKGKLQPITVEEHLRERFDGTYSSEAASQIMAAVA
ncbi:hypothetical protein MNV49_004858 [Pseudohyphozyma bogoriensis]|nr:hypothetical protein MNV49_004858 [Pseudohyphozyma bogoriensis]